LRYTDYSEAPGVLRAEEKTEFRALVRKLAEDPSFYGEIKARQEAVMRAWGMQDGKSSERMLELFNRLTTEGGRTAS
jgi:hypothetical protein